jgi:hypothetical protein
MSISAEIRKEEPRAVEYRWMLYENGQLMGTTRSATIVRAVRCHDEVVAALAGLVKWIDEGRIASDLTFYSEPARRALASARGEVAS